MKHSMALSLLFTGLIIGCSHIQGPKRTPSSTNFSNGDKPKQNLPCGLEGNISQRITDCSNQQGLKTNLFILVSRTKDFKEVYLDTKTDLLWSDRLDNTMNHPSALKACQNSLPEVAEIKDLNWKLPTIQQFKQAERNGIRKALPNMNHWFWSSLISVKDENHSWLFDGFDGETDRINGKRYHFVSVRCIAEAQSSY